MTLFEFLMAIASVVIAIALTEMFGGWGNLLRTHVRPKVDWLHLGWTILITLYAIQYWVGNWPYRDIEFQSVYQVWFLIFPTVFIFNLWYLTATAGLIPDPYRLLFNPITS